MQNHIGYMLGFFQWNSSVFLSQCHFNSSYFEASIANEASGALA